MAQNVRLKGKGRKGDPELTMALASGATVRDAAASAGVSERTAFRRLQDPAFRADVQDVRTLLISQTLGKLIDAGSDAADTLRALLNAKAEHVKLGSARAILELAPKLRESEELAARIAKLEDHLEQMPQTGARQWRA